MLKHYQRLYRYTDYGSAKASPGFKLFDRVASYLRGPVADLGCGRNLFVERCREAGIPASGFDWVAHGADHVGDITGDMDLSEFETATSFDVLEHLRRPGIEALLQNVGRVPRCILTVHTGPSRRWLGRELHITQMPWPEWRELLSLHIEIVKADRLTGRRWLCFGEAH